MNNGLAIAILDIILGAIVIAILWLHLSGRLLKRTQPSPIDDETVKRLGLVLGVVLILAGAAVIGSASLVVEDMDDTSPELRAVFRSSMLQAYVVAAVGVGMVLYHTMPKPDEQIPLLRPVSPSSIAASDTRLPSPVAPREKRLGDGFRWLLYLLSILSPFVGSVAGSILYTRDELDYIRVGKICIVLATVPLVIGALLGALLYLAFGTPS